MFAQMNLGNGALLGAMGCPIFWVRDCYVIPGLGHYEINMVKCAFKLLWDVVLERLEKLLGFKSIRALTSCQNCSDHHKAWQIIQIMFFGTVDELLIPYIEKCIDSKSIPDVIFWNMSKIQTLPL